MAIDFARMVMSYHPSILVHFSRVALAGTVFFFCFLDFPGGRSACKRMALGWRYFVRRKVRMAVGWLNFETYSDDFSASHVLLDGRLGW